MAGSDVEAPFFEGGEDEAEEMQDMVFMGADDLAQDFQKEKKETGRTKISSQSAKAAVSTDNRPVYRGLREKKEKSWKKRRRVLTMFVTAPRLDWDGYWGGTLALMLF